MLFGTAFATAPLLSVLRSISSRMIALQHLILVHLSSCMQTEYKIHHQIHTYSYRKIPLSSAFIHSSLSFMLKATTYTASSSSPNYIFTSCMYACALIFVIENSPESTNCNQVVHFDCCHLGRYQEPHLQQT